ncbi:MAG: hydantoinase/oxoprolinase family protein [Candidatus Heimdallarchaeota archaeon]|nr:hydantoinase/oxoprolinase family protein [Candidatus Heimdallarchaeota archaeon]
MNNETSQQPVRIGIDTGGTFTDYVIVSEGYIRAWKTSTTPEDPSAGIIFGFNEIMDKFHFQKNDVEIIVHGTTIGTNAFLEDKCPPIAFLTTKGFKDIIEIGRQQRSDLYNLKFEQKYPVNFNKDFLYEIEERMDNEGKILTPLDLNSLNDFISNLKSKSIETTAVSLLFSFLNPSHENEISQFLSEKGFNVFTSFEISPQIKEYERSVTTIVNAKVSPVVNSYLSRLQNKLVRNHIHAPLLIMQSNTGMSDVSTIGKSGIQTLYSGLAGGVLAAAESLKHLNRTHLVSLDIGGTSTDVSTLIDGPIVLRERNFGGFPLVASMVDVETIGSGGGSIAKFKDGLLTVGPESQGANPGPACYSLGGKLVTLTDANLYLGYVNENNFAGNLNIDKEKSIQYLNDLYTEINSSPFSLDIESIDELAISIRKILNNNIANAIRVVTIQRGLDPRDFALLGFGGAGPLQSWEIAQELEMGGVVIPPFPGVWSAFGLISSDIKHEKTQSYLQTTDNLDLEEINNKMQEIQQNLGEILNSEEVAEEKHRFNYSLDIRYVGQSDFLTLDIAFPLTESQLAETISRFQILHNQTYSWFDKELQVEVVNTSVIGIGLVPRIELPKLTVGNEQPPQEAYKKSRKVNFEGNWIDTPVFEKSQLLANNILDGPCIIDQLDTTTVIPPGVKGIVDKLGYIALEEMK